MNRCFGITRNYHRCGRVGNWFMFCPEHCRQPIAWLFFLIFTILAGSASIYSVLFPTSIKTEKILIQSEPTKVIVEKQKVLVQNSRSKDRAWLVIEPVKPIPRTKSDGTIGASFDYELYIKNVGEKEARNIAIRANRVSSGLDMGDKEDQIQRAQNLLLREYIGDNNRIAKTLAPNAVSTVPFRLSGQEPQLFQEGGLYSFLIGRIEYQGTNSEQHWMTFCYVISSSRGDLLNCKEGNDIDNHSP